MKKKELIAAVEKHWEHWADHLGLQNWRVIVEVNKRTDIGAMSIDWPENYCKATLTVYPKVEAAAGEFQGDCLSLNVLHETLHVVAHQLKTYGELEVGSTRGHHWLLFSAAQENAIDTLTGIIWRMHKETGCQK